MELRTMNDVYGDGSDCICCNGCGRDVDHGDCLCRIESFQSEDLMKRSTALFDRLFIKGYDPKEFEQIKEVYKTTLDELVTRELIPLTDALESMNLLEKQSFQVS